MILRYSVYTHRWQRPWKSVPIVYGFRFATIRYCFSKPKSTQEQEEEDGPEEVHIPTLEEAAALAKGIKSQAGLTSSEKSQSVASASTSQAEPSKAAVTSARSDESMDDLDIEEAMSKIPITSEGAKAAAEPQQPVEDEEEQLPRRAIVGPLRDVGPAELKKYLKDLGFQDFRPGQEAVVNRILRGSDESCSPHIDARVQASLYIEVG